VNPSDIDANAFVLVDPDFSFLNLDNCATSLKLMLDCIIFDSLLDIIFPPEFFNVTTGLELENFQDQKSHGCGQDDESSKKNKHISVNHKPVTLRMGCCPRLLTSTESNSY